MSEFSYDTTIEVVEAPTFQYISSIDGSAWQKIELVKKYDLVDGTRFREMAWHRYSYADAVSGPYEILFNIPFGYAAVSGSAL